MKGYLVIANLLEHFLEVVMTEVYLVPKFGLVSKITLFWMHKTMVNNIYR